MAHYFKSYKKIYHFFCFTQVSQAGFPKWRKKIEKILSYYGISRFDVNKTGIFSSKTAEKI